MHRDGRSRHSQSRGAPRLLLGVGFLFTLLVLLGLPFAGAAHLHVHHAHASLQAAPDAHNAPIDAPIDAHAGDHTPRSPTPQSPDAPDCQICIDLLVAKLAGSSVALSPPVVVLLLSTAAAALPETKTLLAPERHRPASPRGPPQG